MFVLNCCEQLFPKGIDNLKFAKKWMVVSEDLKDTIRRIPSCNLKLKKSLNAIAL